VLAMKKRLYLPVISNDPSHRFAADEFIPGQPTVRACRARDAHASIAGRSVDSGPGDPTRTRAWVRERYELRQTNRADDGHDGHTSLCYDLSNKRRHVLDRRRGSKS
jgi:hypothetical protein